MARVEAEARRALADGDADAHFGAFPVEGKLAAEAELLRRHLLAVARGDELTTRGRHYVWFAQQLGEILHQADTPRELARLLGDVLRLLRTHISD